MIEMNYRNSSRSNKHFRRIHRRMRGVLASMLMVGIVGITTARAGSPFEDGRADRRAWETWFGSLTDEFQDGAEFWAAHRSDPQQPSCLASSRGPAFYYGCKGAKARLDPTDLRRKSEPEYKAGWNSPVDVASTPPPAAPKPDPSPLPPADKSKGPHSPQSTSP